MSEFSLQTFSVIRFCSVLWCINTTASPQLSDISKNTKYPNERNKAENMTGSEKKNKITVKFLLIQIFYSYAKMK